MAGQDEGGAGRAAARIAQVACIGFAVVSATLLHFAPDRAWGAAVVPLGAGWAVAAAIAAFAGRVQPAWAIVLLAVLARAALIDTPPVLSDDVYRYLFEGRALLAGHDPFVTPPAALAGFEEALRARVNHPEISSIYPPIALAWFAGLAALGAGVTGAQLAAALADVATVGALLAAGGPARRGAVLYALHPLAVLESAHGAHLEAPAVALLAWACASPRAGPGLAALGAGIKLFPALILVPLARRAGVGAAAVGLVLAAAAIALAAWPVLGAGSALLDGFGQYATRWAFNGFAWPAVRALLDEPTARRALLAAGAAVALAAPWRHRDRPARAWIIIGAAFVLLSPTVHPWYGLWVLAPAAMTGRWGAAVGVAGLLAGYGALSAFDATTGAWSEPAWLWPATWLPLLAGLGFDAVRDARSASITPAPPTKA